MTPLLIGAAAWMLAVLLVVALCQAAQFGDQSRRD